jgi:hypothetical protein
VPREMSSFQRLGTLQLPWIRWYSFNFSNRNCHFASLILLVTCFQAPHFVVKE